MRLFSPDGSFVSLIVSSDNLPIDANIANGILFNFVPYVAKASLREEFV